MLIAQMNRPRRGGDDLDPEMVAILVVFCVIVMAVAFTIKVFYLLTLSRCFNRIAPRNRLMEPSLVWLNLIPCFEIVWIFFTTSRLADSLRDEFADRQLRGDGDYGRTLGLVYPILVLVGMLPYVGVLFSIGALICWIIYWVKIADYSRRLEADDQDYASDEFADEEEYSR